MGIREYILYADESLLKGEFYSNFYGGALVSLTDLEEAEKALADVKHLNNLLNEIKWSKVTEQYLAKYISVINVFFDLIGAGKIKVRIMFTQNSNVPAGLTLQQREKGYYLLYYQFIKHAFGLAHMPPDGNTTRLRIYLDEMSDTKESRTSFKSHLVALQHSPDFQRNKVLVPLDQIAEVHSHDHVVLQCLDVVLGAMQFRLNNMHLQKTASAGKRRGKRTIAKEVLYKQILFRIQQIYPGFNIGVSTGYTQGKSDRWNHPYRHWRFIPVDFVVDTSKTKSFKTGLAQKL